MPRSKAHTVTGDAAQVRALLAWAREVGVDLESVSVGTCSVSVRQRAGAVPERAEGQDPRQAIYEQFGGEAYRRMMGSRVGGDAVPGEEMQPALEMSDG